MTFVKAKLTIEKAASGDTIEILLQGAEPLVNVPKSAREMGLEILALRPEPGADSQGMHRLLLKKP